jgi:hypothetical protein
MKSTILVPESHEEHRRRAGLLDWMTVAVWLLLLAGFVLSVAAPARSRAEAGLESAAAAAPAAPAALAGAPCPAKTARTRC